MRISGSNVGYTMFRGSVKGTDYTLHSPVSPSLPLPCKWLSLTGLEGPCSLRLKCDGTRAESRFRLLAKRTSPFKSAGGRQFSRLLTAEVCGISGSNAGYTMFRGSVKSTGYPRHSSVSPTLPLPCVTVVPSHFNWSLTG